MDLETPCALGEVLRRTSSRVQDLVGNMQRFSAREQVTFREIDRHRDRWISKEATFSYVAYIHEAAPQQLAVEEYRDDSVALQDFPSRLATLGTVAFALIFHPNYVKDFSVTCEGLTQWQGRRAWRLHLVQTEPNNFRGYRLANRYFRVMLKARAWIDAETFEVLRLETDLRDPIADIPLLLEHVIVDYAMVDFSRRNLQLWLPRQAEIYMDYRGRQYHHRHTFSNFQLFWVDTEQTVKVPQVAASEPMDLPANVAPESAPVVTKVEQREPSAQVSNVAAAAVVPAVPPPVMSTQTPPASAPTDASVRKQAPEAPAMQIGNIAVATSQPAVHQEHSTQQVPIVYVSTKPVEPPAHATQEPAERPGSIPPQVRDVGPPTFVPAVPEPARPQDSTGAQSSSPRPKPVPGPTVALNLKEQPDFPALESAKAKPRERPLEDCPECLHVLISLKDTETGRLRDNLRTRAQDDWIKRHAEQLVKAKGNKIRLTPDRDDAEYNIVWSAGFTQGTTYRTMLSELIVLEIKSGRRLFYTSHESRYWEAEHPEQKCLQDAINFLKNSLPASKSSGSAP